MSKDSHSCYSAVVDMNIQGILMMQHSQHVEAVAYFHGGLQTLLTRLVDPCSSNENSTPAKEDFLMTHENHHTPCSFNAENELEKIDEQTDGKILRSAALKVRKVSVLHDDVFLLFDRALQLSPEVMAVVSQSQLYSHLMPSVLIYNIGLANHLHGLQQGDSKAMSRALDFYSMAYNTLTELSASLGELSHLLNLSFLSIVNNMGHIHAYFRNFMEAGICSDELARRLAALLSPANSFGAVVPSISDEEYKTFFLNVCFSQGSEQLSAPAA